MPALATSDPESPGGSSIASVAPPVDRWHIAPYSISPYPEQGLRIFPGPGDGRGLRTLQRVVALHCAAQCSANSGIAEKGGYAPVAPIANPNTHRIHD